MYNERNTFSKQVKVHSQFLKTDDVNFEYITKHDNTIFRLDLNNSKMFFMFKNSFLQKYAKHNIIYVTISKQIND